MRQTYSRSEESEKILGIIFDPNITWKNHINYLRQKGFKYLNAIKALSSPKIGTRSDHLLNIINATIRSIFDYGSQLFSFSSNSNRQRLEPIYNAALRLTLGLPRNTPLDLLRAESMNGSINTCHNFLCQKFITKQTALKDWSPNASDEAHFWLNGYVSKQNCRIWSEANPQVYVETPLHPEKLTVWCALWAGGILLQKRGRPQRYSQW
ncbi:putative RNA-directed DNA polymerase from transposon BS [Trichonephila clavipes]|nr:putative RNA-directed DNA polymerase from transposon BS [Trichonephila clavipes]